MTTRRRSSRRHTTCVSSRYRDRVFHVHLDWTSVRVYAFNFLKTEIYVSKLLTRCVSFELFTHTIGTTALTNIVGTTVAFFLRFPCRASRTRRRGEIYPLRTNLRVSPPFDRHDRKRKCASNIF